MAKTPDRTPGVSKEEGIELSDEGVDPTVDGEIRNNGGVVKIRSDGVVTVPLNAIHRNVAGEIAGVVEKVSPVAADLLLIEDSAAANAKKRVQVGNLPGGGGGDTITVNGSATAATNVDLDDATPAAPAGQINVAWQKDALDPTNVSANVTDWSVDQGGSPQVNVANVQDSNEAQKGVIEIATQVETDAGTDDARAVTPLKLATSFPWKMYDAIVAPSGTPGDYTTVGAAINAGKKRIFVREGTYTEATSWAPTGGGWTIVGESAAVVLDFADAALVDGFKLQEATAPETAGTVATLAADATVVGTGTTFTNLAAGEFISMQGTVSEIASITDATNLELKTPWRGTAKSGRRYWAKPLLKGFYFENLTFKQLGTGRRSFDLRGCYDITIRNVRVEDTSNTSGPKFFECAQVRIEGGLLLETQGYLFDRCTDVNLYGVSVEGVGAGVTADKYCENLDIHGSFLACGTGINLQGDGNDNVFLARLDVVMNHVHSKGISTEGDDVYISGVIDSDSIGIEVTADANRTTISGQIHGDVNDITDAGTDTAVHGAVGSINSADSLGVFTANDAFIDGVVSPTLGIRNKTPTVDYDDGIQEFAYFEWIMPANYGAGNSMTVDLIWVAATATTGDVVWRVAFDRMNTDIDTDGFDTAKSVTTTTSGTSGIPVTSSISFTPTEMDNLAVNERFRFYVERNAIAAGDNMSGDAQLIGVQLRQ